MVTSRQRVKHTKKNSKKCVCVWGGGKGGDCLNIEIFVCFVLMLYFPGNSFSVMLG